MWPLAFVSVNSFNNYKSIVMKMKLSALCITKYEYMNTKCNDNKIQLFPTTKPCLAR